MKTKSILLSLITLMLAVAGIVAAERIKELNESVPAEGAEDVVVDVEFGLGRLTVEPKDMSDVASFDCRYDPRYVDYAIDKNVRGRTLYISAESDVDNDDRNRGRNRRIDGDDFDNDMDVVLSTRYPMEMHLSMGACKAELDLGGIPLRELTLEIGAASGNIDFSRANPERMDELEIEVGASSVDLTNIGNANFRRFKFSGGAGSFDLDLRGQYTGESEVELELGVASADIILPKDIPVRVESEGGNWFSKVDFHGGDLEEVEDDVYETPGFDKAKVRLIVHVEVGMGSADFGFKE